MGVANSETLLRHLSISTCYYRYICGVDTPYECVTYVYGPCPAATFEVIMVRMSGLLEAIPKGCAWVPRCSCCICFLCFIFTGHKVIADGDFRGEPAIIVPFRRAEATTNERKGHNRRLSRLRWKIEWVFNRLKSFKNLKCIYRHKLSQHRLIFLALIALYNIDVARHPLEKGRRTY